MLTALRKHTKLIMAIVIGFFVVSIFAGYGMYNRSGHSDGRDYVVAKIDGDKVMRSNLEQATMRLLEQMPNSSEVGSEDILQVRKSILDSMVVEKELAKEAKSRKIEVTKDEIDAAYQQIMAQYPTRETFFQQLQQMNLTEQQVKDDLKNQLTQQKVINELTGDVVVSEDEVAQYYELTKGFMFHQPEGFKLNIATFNNKLEAERVRKAIAGGADWDETLKAVPAADLRGYTPYAQPELMPENIMTGPVEQLKKLAMGKVSSVIEITSEDFSIAVKRSRETARTLSYDEVSADLRQNLRAQRAQMKQGEVFRELASRAKVEIVDASIFPAPRQPLPDIGSIGSAPASPDAPSSPDAN